MRIAFVWTGFTSYMADCWRRLVSAGSRLGGEVELRVWIEDVSTGAGRLDAARLMRGLDWWSATGEELRAERGKLKARVEDEIVDWKPDALIICGWARELPPYLAASERLRAIPKILCCDMPWEWKVRKFAARFVLWRRLRRFRKIMVPGAAAAKYARWLGFAERDIIRGEYAIDVRRFALDGSDGDGRRRKGFLFVGRKVPEKGVEVLTRAYEIYRKSAEPGDEAWELDVPEWIDPKDVPQAMRGHACLVLPSHREPWGVVVAEALAAGMRVIVSDRVGARLDLPVDAVFKDGDAEGLAAALRRVSSGAADRPALPALGFYDCESWAERVVNAVREVVAGRGGGQQ